MAKVSWLQSRLLIIAIIIILAVPIQAAIRQQPRQFLTADNKTYLASSLGSILEQLRRRRRSGGSRGDICAIAPANLVEPNSQTAQTQTEPIPKVWSDRPLFAWHNPRVSVRRIQLFIQGNPEVLWSKNIASGETKVIYDGKPLQPGQSYEWQLFAPFSIKQPNFQVMAGQQRDRITDELTKLETQLKKQRASAEVIALEKANYFAQKELWSDALLQLYSVSNPSAELSEMIRQIQTHNFCLPIN
jgi:Domain of Unknown Function (DUF928)